MHHDLKTHERARPDTLRAYHGLRPSSVGYRRQNNGLAVAYAHHPPEERQFTSQFRYIGYMGARLFEPIL
jgi:hypothetical protein